MSGIHELPRHLVAFSLVYLAAVLAAYLWFVDLFTMQGTFGAILGAELVLFAMLAHIYLKPTFAQASKPWLLAGCVFLVVLLVIAL
ncbi:MAG: hypothetical protein LYZ70_03430 [Nitrososphaerales archaeon]|nr:hypothetical protein [Nitrososphaerales archaeon]